MKHQRSRSSDEQPGNPPKAKSKFSHLCSDCSIDWSLLAQTSKNNQPVDQFSVAVTKSHKELRSSFCEVCQLLAFLKPSDLDNSACILKARNLTQVFTPNRERKYPGQSDTAILSIVSESNKQPEPRKNLGHVIAVEPSLQGPSFPIHEGVNFRLIQEWMARCVDEHAPKCRPGARSSTEPLDVIDCTKEKHIDLKKPKVISLSGDFEYAALSYVWGNVNDDFPQVVKDSIKVVRQLGCGYLWVDRHCIDQDDRNAEKQKKKQKQIEKMDEIYSQAKFTIVAAAGNDCKDGLAGITYPRMPHQYAQVHGAKLTYLGTPPAEKIRSSRWGSRGWTYQEGFLSHRRIFFTDEQVVFQCNTMTCIESFNIPTGVLYKLEKPKKKKKPTEKKKPKERKKPFLTDTEPLSLAQEDIMDHLEEFSKRNLTKDSDTLKAFLGVLNDFRKNGKCLHLYGNPIPLEKKKGRLINAWYHTRPGARNVNFPSWSWAGWKSGIKATSRGHPDYEIRLFKSKTTSPENIDDALRLFTPDNPISVDDYKDECSTNPSLRMEPIIGMTGMMTKLSFEVIKWNSEAVGPNEGDNKISMQDGAWAMLPFTADDIYYSFLYLDNEALTGIRQFKLPVMVLQSGKEKPNQNIVILVLREKGVRRFERVGMIILWRGDNEAKAKLNMRRDKNGKWTQPESIPKLQEFTLWEKLRDQRIQLQ